MKMENAEEIFHFLEEFSKRKPKTIPQELNDYLAYVARTGDPVYQWALVKALFKEKLLNVITDFYETTPGIDIPPYPNVDPFNYDTMKNSLLERLDSFTSAPFTVQRICELLTCPRKQYHRVDKFMRAIEKNILVVSTREPGIQRHIEIENGEPMEAIVNGSDNNSEYNVDVEMEEMSWKENAEPTQSSEPQPSSSDTHISIEDIEARLKAKQEQKVSFTQDKATTQYESVTPPELNVTSDEQVTESKPTEELAQQPTTSSVEEPKPDQPEPVKPVDTPAPSESPKQDEEMATETTEHQSQTLVIPEIKVDDAEMTEQKLTEQEPTEVKLDPVPIEKEPEPSVEPESKPASEEPPITTDESSSDSNPKEETDSKLISEIQTSSEESSSSSDNTDANSNSPKTVESNTETQEESSQSDAAMEEPAKQTEPVEVPPPATVEETPQALETDNYSISDVKSELPQPPAEPAKTEEPIENKEKVDDTPSEPEKENVEVKMDSTETPTENPSVEAS
ncbi:serine/threonine-protein phosphatase 4 regulatory subunit 2 [Ostrinia furnacalis]|uniref:serine/threonine-protein phosphatase 4 regulatory subunit 2 n=1 Tax=Ostrinia furnacalis TaxID=93504 RepID=UPI001039A6E2|nr:serine/threonine-protein phosphatase 4 regulatory subunit 2 [Ostrinia furnacalis]